MSHQRTTRLALIAVAALTAACGGQRRPVAQPEPVAAVTPERLDTVILLPDEGVTTAGRLVVRTAGGEMALEEPWAAARVPADGPPRVAPSLTADVLDRVRDVVTALPAAPTRFTLHFKLESEKLTEESLSRLTDVRAAATGRPAVEVFVSGHTDRSGATDANVSLGLARAAAIRDLLISAGVPGAAIHITSHGEATPIVPTRDGAFEPRNRRVDITVR